MTHGLTPKQAEVFGFIRTRIMETGVSPTYAEIMSATGLITKSHVNRIVVGLEQRGAIVRIARKTRSIGLVDGITVNPHPEVRRAIDAYAVEHNISVETACHEALRAYFVEAAAQ
ncbi:hypothetical protein J4G48_0015305 [Bradyrhizobium barranii subsp. apii]|uniref:LexA family protein n=1 Tax=Bradyrhizobium barranii TaxID=2992140 RepID=UPI001AA17348|nr:hypothetical protein [Bradyrhizobium barranii]UPT99331.1 hypothetical protein J4G48_0015305 [Bradyrhizobium barranii subsp. apii]